MPAQPPLESWENRSPKPGNQQERQLEFSWCLQHRVLQERRHVRLRRKPRTEVRKEPETGSGQSRTLACWLNIASCLSVRGVRLGPDRFGFSRPCRFRPSPCRPRTGTSPCGRRSILGHHSAATLRGESYRKEWRNRRRQCSEIVP